MGPREYKINRLSWVYYFVDFLNIDTAACQCPVSVVRAAFHVIEKKA